MSKLPIRVIRVPSAPAADGDPFDALRRACDRFNETLDATTVPADGGKRILDAPGAIALSEATRALFNALAGSVPRLAGAGATLVAAWFRSASVAGFPPSRWNEMQARSPGADHPRWSAGDVVSKADLEVLATVPKLLRLEPRAVPTLAPAPSTDVAPPGLSPNVTLVVETMARFDGSRLLSAKRIEEEMNLAHRLSERTIRKVVVRLIELELAERPDGKRSGARLTMKGRRLAPKIAD